MLLEMCVNIGLHGRHSAEVHRARVSAGFFTDQPCPERLRDFARLPGIRNGQHEVIFQENAEVAMLCAIWPASPMPHEIQRQKLWRPGEKYCGAPVDAMSNYFVCTKLFSRKVSASTVHKPLFRSQMSASCLYSGLVSPSFAKSEIGVNGISM